MNNKLAEKAETGLSDFGIKTGKRGSRIDKSNTSPVNRGCRTDDSYTRVDKSDCGIDNSYTRTVKTGSGIDGSDTRIDDRSPKTVKTVYKKRRGGKLRLFLLLLYLYKQRWY